MRWQGCVQNVQCPCLSRLFLLQQSLGKHANEGGREMCSILILHGWHILWNKLVIFCPSASFTCFFLLWKKRPQSEVWAEAVNTCTTAPPNGKKKTSHLFQVWFEFPKLWLLLIGLKEWEPERINGFCWSVQGWTQRKRQCVFVYLCPCLSALPPLWVRKEGQSYPALTPQLPGHWMVEEQNIR